jgi:hypothetical protein
MSKDMEGSDRSPILKAQFPGNVRRGLRQPRITSVGIFDVPVEIRTALPPITSDNVAGCALKLCTCVAGPNRTSDSMLRAKGGGGKCCSVSAPPPGLCNLDSQEVSSIISMRTVIPCDVALSLEQWSIAVASIL